MRHACGLRLAPASRALNVNHIHSFIHSSPLDAFPKGFHLDAAADDERRPLMNALRLDVENPAPAVGRQAAGLLDQKRDRIGFVEEPQFSAGMIGGRRIKKNAPFKSVRCTSATIEPM